MQKTGVLSKEKKTNRPLVLASVILAMFMAAVEATIVSTAMPSIVGELGGFQLFSWVFSSFLLMQAVTVPIYGKLADLYGRKPVLTAGIILFLVGSVLCGLATSMKWMIIFRFIQGIGAGAVLPIATTIVGDIYTMEERAKIQGYLSSVWGISSIIGPLLGGIFVEHLHWAWVFWINVPVGIVTIAGLWLFLHEEVEKNKHPVDVWGSGLLFVSVSALMLVLTQGGVAWSWVSAPVILLVLLFIFSGTLFIYAERKATEPMMPFHIWKNRLIALSNLASLTTGAVMIGIASYLPAHVQGVMGYSPTVAGFALAMMSIGWPLAATIASKLMLKLGFRMTAGIGGIFLVIGSLFFVFLQSDAGPVWAGAGSFLIGAGMGLSATTFIVSIQSSVDWNTRGVATASNMFMRILGNTVGIAFLGGILNSRLVSYLAGRTDDAHSALDAAHRLLNPAAEQQLPLEFAQLIREGLQFALHHVYWVVLFLSLVSLAIIVFLPRGETKGL